MFGIKEKADEQIGGVDVFNEGREVESRYYHALGRSSDLIVRCKDCKRLNVVEELQKRGSCRCGNKRHTEITTLTGWEMFKLRTGIIDFPYRREMLREFGLVAWW